MRMTSFVVAATAACLGFASPALAESNVKVGTLSCDVAPGVGLIITSSKALSCTFKASNGRREHYSGHIRKLGLDIGVTSGGVLVWAVFAPKSGPAKRALAGEYGGVDASASIGVGAGANLLVGGFNRSFTLQPLSVEGQTGVALAAGVASLRLD